METFVTTIHDQRMSANAFSCDTKPFNGCTDEDAEYWKQAEKLKVSKWRMKNERWRIMDEEWRGVIFDEWTEHFWLIVAFATEN